MMCVEKANILQMAVIAILLITVLGLSSEASIIIGAKTSFGEYLGACELDSHCNGKTTDSKSNLVCKSGICDCDQDSVYNKYLKRCEKLASRPCLYGEDSCVSHASCSSRKGICSCWSDYPEDPLTGLCLVNYDGFCSFEEHEPCNSGYGLVCKDGRCKCEFDDHQYFDVKQNTCKSLVMGPCGNNSTFQCTDNAECVVVDGIGECRCKNGFVPVERKCELAYGQRCEYGYNAPRCDRLGPLYCKNGVCQCAEFQFYDQVQLKCRGLVGSKCDTDEEGFCAEGSFCNKFRNFKSDKSGRCECKPGYALVADKRECVKPETTPNKDD